MKKRIIAFLLCMTVFVCALPAGVFAEENQEPVPPVQTGEPVAKIGDVTYTTLDEAVTTAADGALIEILRDCELKTGFNKSLTFTGNGKITINDHLTTGVEGWMILGSGKVLTVDGSGVEVLWNSFGASPWLMLSLSGTINVTNGATFTFHFNSTSGTRNAVYMNSGSVINVSNGSTFQIIGEGTANNSGQGIQLDKAGTATINVSDKSTFLIDGTNRGYVNSPTINVTDSTFTIQNCTSNASNGGIFNATNSTINYLNNNGHGLSVTTLTSINSTFNCNDNAYYGITSTGNVHIDGTSKINTYRNGTGYIGGGFRVQNGTTVATICSGAVVNVCDNLHNGIENYAQMTYENGVILTVTGNNERSTNGGGIFNGATGSLILPANAVVTNNHAVQTGGGICNAGYIEIPVSVDFYNNHADIAGDDLLNRDGATAGLTAVGSDWYLDGGEDCFAQIHPIDGWYHDGEGNRWEAHAYSYDGNHVELFDIAEGTAVSVTGLTALKAAHGVEYGELTVSKAVVNDIDDREFSFKLSLYQQDGKRFKIDELTVIYDYTMWGSIPADENGDFNFTLSSGDSITFRGIPEYVAYTVTELDANQYGYKTEYVNQSGVINADRVTGVSVNNIKPVDEEAFNYGSLQITKTVVGDEEDLEKSFEFRVTFENVNTQLAGNGFVFSGPGYSGTFHNGDVFTLGDGDSLTITGIPIGTRYTVEEISSGDDYSITSIGSSGVIAYGTQRAEFVNSFSDEEDVVIILPEQGFSIVTELAGVAR